MSHVWFEQSIAIDCSTSNRFASPKRNKACLFCMKLTSEEFLLVNFDAASLKEKVKAARNQLVHQPTMP